jgi:hypothetical protein
MRNLEIIRRNIRFAFQLPLFWGAPIIIECENREKLEFGQVESRISILAKVRCETRDLYLTDCHSWVEFESIGMNSWGYIRRSRIERGRRYILSMTDFFYGAYCSRVFMSLSLFRSISKSLYFTLTSIADWFACPTSAPAASTAVPGEPVMQSSFILRPDPEAARFIRLQELRGGEHRTREVRDW